MLISTSRKPSAKTRKFCKNFSHATGSNYVNRGKMNMRELLLKALEFKEDNIAVVNEVKGNPSKITFYDLEGNIKIILLITASLSNERLHINPKYVTIKSDFDDLNILSEIFNFPLDDKKENYIHIVPVSSEENEKETKEYNKKIARINFYNKFGNLTDFQIIVRKFLYN